MSNFVGRARFVLNKVVWPSEELKGHKWSEEDQIFPEVIRKRLDCQKLGFDEKKICLITSLALVLKYDALTNEQFKQNVNEMFCGNDLALISNINMETKINPKKIIEPFYKVIESIELDKLVHFLFSMGAKASWELCFLCSRMRKQSMINFLIQEIEEESQTFIKELLVDTISENFVEMVKHLSLKVLIDREVDMKHRLMLSFKKDEFIDHQLYIRQSLLEVSTSKENKDVLLKFFKEESILKMMKHKEFKVLLDSVGKFEFFEHAELDEKSSFFVEYSSIT